MTTTLPATRSSSRPRRDVSLRSICPRLLLFAAHEFIVGALLDNPQRVGKPLHAPLDDRHSARRGTYRVIYRIDDAARTVTVVDIAHRRDAYRGHR